MTYSSKNDSRNKSEKPGKKLKEYFLLTTTATKRAIQDVTAD